MLFYTSTSSALECRLAVLTRPVVMLFWKIYVNWYVKMFILYKYAFLCLQLCWALNVGFQLHPHLSISGLEVLTWAGTLQITSLWSALLLLGPVGWGWGVTGETVRLEEEDKDTLCFFLLVFQHWLFSWQQQSNPVFFPHLQNDAFGSVAPAPASPHPLLWGLDLRSVGSSYKLPSCENINVFLLLLLLSL